MDFHSIFPKTVQAALANDPPGAWMPTLPASCIRLSAGYPSPSLVPSHAIGDAVNKLIKEERDLPFHYLGSPHIGTLHQQILKRLSERNMNIQEKELIITAGGCQAIDLIARTLLDQDSVVIVEAPTYMEALEIFKNYTQQIISIPVDRLGLQTSILEKILNERKQNNEAMPSLLYTIPSFQNPTGTTLPNDRRQKLLELAEEFGFLILEDDAYGELSFGDSPETIKSKDRNHHVLYVGSFSKVIAPGMRIGWIAGHEELIAAFQWFKKDLDHPFAQATMASFLETLLLQERIDILQAAYRTRRDLIVSALEQFMPKNVTWTIPGGGFFVWLHVPGVNTTLILRDCLQSGVSYVPGQYFFLTQQDGLEYLRLSFSYEDPENIVEGIKRIGEICRKIMSKML